MGKVVHIRQTDSYDCGAACLAAIAVWWGINLPLSSIRKQCGCSKDGITIRGLADGAEAIGLSAKALKADLQAQANTAEKVSKLLALRGANGPVIAHVLNKEGMLHYVVIYKISTKYLKVMDPARDGIRRVNIRDFAERWSGYIVLISTGDGYRRVDGKEGRWVRILRLMALYRKEICFALAGSIVLSAVGICNSLLLQMLIDNVLPASDKSLLLGIGVIILTFIPLSLLIGYFRDLYLIQAGVKTDTALIIGFMKRIMRMDESFFRDYPKGELESRLSDTYKIRAFITGGIVSAIVCICTIVAVSILMFSFYSSLAIILLTCLPIYMLLFVIADRINRRLSRKVMSAAATFENDVIDCIEGQRAIRHFGTDPSSLNFNASFTLLAHNSYKAGKFSAIVGGIGNGISQVIMACIIIIGGAGVLTGRLSLGELVSFYTLSAFFIAPMNSLVQVDSLMNDALVASDRIYDITSSYISVYDSLQVRNLITISSADTHILELQQVHFRYRGGMNLIENLSHVFYPGTITGICGPNGCGKSTLAALLTKDYIPRKGKITYGGIDITLLDSHFWRSVLSVVPQSSHLFNATILDNITMALGTKEFSLIDKTVIDKVTECCILAGMQNILQRLEHGIFTSIGQDKAFLSGGERQMILIARMLYANPKIIVFDETSANMDANSKENLKQLVTTLKHNNKCIIMITHDKQMLDICDNTIELTGRS